jgi:DNA-binding MarR family transcriptional regulator/GNAT superfamily N-acetyltransferase
MVRDMSDMQVAALRSFNRTLTERIGALEDEYLARARPLGASRLLWEIDARGTDSRALRSRLGLDSGYLSRLLRSLEDEGLITVTPDPTDARRRSVSLTAAGVNERADLDRDSDALVQSLLSPLSPDQRSRLAGAAAVVERLLTASLVTFAVESPTSAAAQFCLGSYFKELDHRFEAGFDPAISISADSGELTEPAGLLLVARLRGEPIGCGALKLHGDEPAEIKRMWVADSARGLGLGRRLLGEQEGQRCGAGPGQAEPEEWGSESFIVDLGVALVPVLHLEALGQVANDARIQVGLPGRVEPSLVRQRADEDLETLSKRIVAEIVEAGPFDRSCHQLVVGWHRVAANHSCFSNQW